MADRHITSNGRIMYRADRVEVIKYTQYSGLQEKRTGCSAITEKPRSRVRYSFRQK